MGYGQLDNEQVSSRINQNQFYAQQTKAYEAKNVLHSV